MQTIQSQPLEVGDWSVILLFKIILVKRIGIINWELGLYARFKARVHADIGRIWTFLSDVAGFLFGKMEDA